jgi:hypothetical protein
MYRPTGLGPVLRGWFGLLLLFQLARGWLEGRNPAGHLVGAGARSVVTSRARWSARARPGSGSAQSLIPPIWAGSPTASERAKAC